MEEIVLERINKYLTNYQLLFRLLNYTFNFNDGRILIESSNHDYVEINEAKETLNAPEYNKIIRINNETLIFSFLRNGVVSISIDGSDQRISISTKDDLSSWAVEYGERENQWFSKAYTLFSTKQRFSVNVATMCYRQTKALHSSGIKYISSGCPDNIIREHVEVYNNFFSNEVMNYTMAKVKERNGTFSLMASNYQDVIPLEVEPELLINPEELSTYEYYLLNAPQTKEIVTTVMGALERRVANIRSGLITGKCICPKPDNGLLEPINEDELVQDIIKKYLTTVLGEAPIIPVLSKDFCQVN